MKFTKEDIQKIFINLISEEQNLDLDKIDIHTDFYAFGLDSISAIHVLDKLENHLNIEINPIDFWDYPTIEQFTSHLLENKLS